VLYDLGDFIDDYAVDSHFRNDLGMLILVDLGPDGPVRLEAIPLAIDYLRTRLAGGKEALWVRERFRKACAELGTEVHTVQDRSVIEWRPDGAI
jgi:poly-gamma-glutamate synthesis protein (capsule biosynthesis protein)